MSSSLNYVVRTKDAGILHIGFVENSKCINLGTLETKNNWFTKIFSWGTETIRIGQKDYCVDVDSLKEHFKKLNITLTLKDIETIVNSGYDNFLFSKKAEIKRSELSLGDTLSPEKRQSLFEKTVQALNKARLPAIEKDRLKQMNKLVPAHMYVWKGAAHSQGFYHSQQNVTNHLKQAEERHHFWLQEPNDGQLKSLNTKVYEYVTLKSYANEIGYEELVEAVTANPIKEKNGRTFKDDARVEWAYSVTHFLFLTRITDKRVTG